MRSRRVKVTEHRQPFQIAPRGEDDLHLAMVCFFQNFRRSCPKQHPVFGLVNSRERRRVARIHEIESRVKNAAGIFKGGRPPA